MLLDAYAFPYEDILFIGRRSVKTGAVCMFSLLYFFRIIFPSVGAKINFPWGSFFLKPVVVEVVVNEKDC